MFSLTKLTLFLTFTGTLAACGRDYGTQRDVLIYVEEKTLTQPVTVTAAEDGRVVWSARVTADGVNRAFQWFPRSGVTIRVSAENTAGETSFEFVTRPVNSPLGYNVKAAQEGSSLRIECSPPFVIPPNVKPTPGTC